MLETQQNKKQRKLASKDFSHNYFQELCRRIDGIHRGQFCFLWVAIFDGGGKRERNVKGKQKKSRETLIKCRMRSL